MPDLTIANEDSTGTKNLIQPGEIHWASAGSGIVHEEVPAEPGKTVHTLQIFVDLAQEHKIAAPFALTLAPQNIPVVELPGVTVRVPVGAFGDVRSPLMPPSPVTMLEMTMVEDAAMELPIPAGETLFVMPIAGSPTSMARATTWTGLSCPCFLRRTHLELSRFVPQRALPRRWCSLAPLFRLPRLNRR